MKNLRFFGIALVILSAVSFGVMAVLAHYAYSAGFTTRSLLCYRFVIAALVMLPIVMIKKKPFPAKKDMVILVLMGCVGYAGQAFCYFTSLILIPASMTAILLYLYPVFVAVLSIFFLNEQFSRRKLVALCLAMTGVFLVIGMETAVNLKGIAYGVGAAVIYSIYNIVGAKVMARNDAFSSCLIIIASSGMVYLGWNVGSGFYLPTDLTAWCLVGAIALISTVTAIYTYFEGMKYIGAVNASMLSTFEPVTTMLLSFLLLNARIGWMQLAGAALILFSAILVAAKRAKER